MRADIIPGGRGFSLFEATLAIAVLLNPSIALCAPAGQTDSPTSAIGAQNQQQENVAPVDATGNVNGSRLINMHLSGSVVADFVTGSDSESAFGGGTFLPVLLVGYRDWLLFEGHLEFSATSDGETETSLEYAQVDLSLNDNVTVVLGKFLSPIGQFQQAIHPPWINKLPARPPGFVEEGGAEPLSEVGVMVRGAFPVGSLTGTYAAYVGNGPRMGEEGPELEGFADDNNGNKAVGGRLSIFLLPQLELGISGMQTSVPGIEAMSGSATESDYRVIGTDIAFTQGYWDLRGEWIHSHLDKIMSALDPSDSAPTAIPATTWDNWYVQAAYRLAGVSDDPILANFEPVIQYGEFHVRGFDDFAENTENRFTAGLDYWFEPSVVAKISYQNRNFLEGGNDDVLWAQFAFGF